MVKKQNGRSALTTTDEISTIIDDRLAEQQAEAARLREQSIRVATDTITGDIRDFILDRLKHEQDKQPWHKRSESDQRDTVHSVEAAVRTHVARAVELIAAQGQQAINATLVSCTFKDGIKATLEMSKHDPQRHMLADATGGRVVIFVADPEQFEGERNPVTITPDQSDIEHTLAVHSATDRPNPLN